MSEQFPMPPPHYLDVISDGYLALDHEWRYLYVNPAALNVLGRRAQELLGQVIWEVYPDTVERFGPLYRRAMHEGVEVQCEEYYPPLDLWTQLRIFPTPEGIGVLFRDVTEQKRAKQYHDNLLALNALLNAAATPDEVAHAILHSARSDWGQYGGVIALTDAAGQTLSLTHHLGYEAPLTQRWATFSTNLDLPMAHVQRTGEPLFLTAEEAHERFADLRARTGFHSLTCLPLQVNGGPVLGVLAFSYEQPRRFDQPERTFLTTLATHCAQAISRARLYEQARRNELRYRLLTEATSAFTWTSNADLWITEPQPTWSAYTGQTDEQTLGDGWLNAIHPADRPDLHRQMIEGQRQGGPFRLHARVRRADGAYRAIVSNVIPLPSPAHGGPVLMGVVQDVTEEQERAQVLAERHRLIEVLAHDTQPATLANRIIQETAGLMEAAHVALLTCSAASRDCVMLASFGTPPISPVPMQRDLLLRARGTLHDLPNHPRTHLLVLPTRSEWTAALLITLLDDLHVADPRPARLQDVAGLFGAALERAELLRNLSEREAHARSIIEALQEGVVLIQPDGNVTFLNDNARQMLRMPDNQTGRPLTELDFVDQHHLPISPERLPSSRALQGERIFGDIMGHQNGGAVTWWSVHATPLPTPVGGALQAVMSIQDVTHQINLQRELERQAARDELTGLPNRRSFAARLTAALDGSSEASLWAVLLLDLDHFKDVNDVMGHQVGDEVLEHVAARLTQLLGDQPQSMAARLSGDEFGMLIPVQSRQEAAVFADRVLQHLSEPVTVSGYDLHLAASIGVTVAPADGRTVRDLLRGADLAMYRAKGSGRNTLSLFDVELAQQRERRHQVSLELRSALERDALHLQYQPIQTLNEGRLVAVEALARWHSPVLGVVSPAEFIAVAEDTGQILKLGEWVLNAAVRQATAWWRSAGRRVRVSVNVSPLQFLHADFAQVTRAALRAAHLPAEMLQLEITESTVMRDVARTRRQCEELRAMGVRLALDDFGTGYSSLSTLHSLDFHLLKLDRSFVWGLEGDTRREALLRSVVTLAESLSMEIVAEGIETESQRRLLIELGCQLGQGFYLARPLNANDVEQVWGD
ncbi:EAL domain-containing protein [Deinococcus sedimenti]|uniref:EAL domain-containing protein n=1 Tax=Deinococcus sedimenti TaxID=1867090 RepID=A0ABQ2SCC3_9DEIO|nr:EAL domain-containing protein [Deinococcus sedimenti]GGS11330.1 hypothetical protein GCM10008960_41640 [Deinococcus sedimenti]